MLGQQHGVVCGIVRVETCGCSERFGELRNDGSRRVQPHRDELPRNYVRVSEVFSGHDEPRANRGAGRRQRGGWILWRFRGVVSGNITDALTSNMGKKPQRIIQLQKAGNAKQGRKTYKVTHEGLVCVQGMLRGEGS